MKRALIFLGTLLALVVVSACATTETKEDEKGDGVVLDVGGMSLYCLARGKILALIAVEGQKILGGACADPPMNERGGNS